jgi:hypothetical protein
MTVETPLSLSILCKHLFLIVSLKVCSLLTTELRSSNKIFLLFLALVEK